MTMSRHQLTALSAAVALTALTSAALVAQGRQAAMPRYDTATELTVKGTVEAVETVKPGTGRRALGGTHLTLKTEKETLAVHLGPTAFLTAEKVVIEKGDTIEVVGSRVTIDDEAVLLAREVRKGGQTWTLRDAKGVPRWSRRPR